MCKEFGIENSFTLESSFAGPSGGSHFSVAQLEQLGRDLCAAIGEWHHCCSSPGEHRTFAELAPLARRQDRDSGSDSESGDNTQPEPPTTREMQSRSRGLVRASKTRGAARRAPGFPQVAHLHRGIRAAAKLERNAAVHARAMHNAKLCAKPPNSTEPSSNKPSPRSAAFQRKVASRPSTSRVHRPTIRSQLGKHRTRHGGEPQPSLAAAPHTREVLENGSSKPPTISPGLENCTASSGLLERMKVGGTKMDSYQQDCVSLDSYRLAAQLESCKPGEESVAQLLAQSETHAPSWSNGEGDQAVAQLANRRTSVQRESLMSQGSRLRQELFGAKRNDSAKLGRRCERSIHQTHLPASCKCYVSHDCVEIRENVFRCPLRISNAIIDGVAYCRFTSRRSSEEVPLASTPG